MRGIPRIKIIKKDKKEFDSATALAVNNRTKTNESPETSNVNVNKKEIEVKAAVVAKKNDFTNTIEVTKLAKVTVKEGENTNEFKFKKTFERPAIKEIEPERKKLKEIEAKTGSKEAPQRSHTKIKNFDVENALRNFFNDNQHKAG